jgi:hypothetical protein
MGEPEKPKREPRRKPADKAQFERFFASVRKLGGQQSTPPGLEEASGKLSRLNFLRTARRCPEITEN